jgi:hypothetical protein
MADSLTPRLAERDLQIIRACETANQDLDLTEIEKEFDRMGHQVAEPWN